MEADAKPFPRDETTPPVTKINLVLALAMIFSFLHSPQIFLRLLQIQWCIDLHRGLIHIRDPDTESMRQRPKLLQSLGPFEGYRPQAVELEKKLTPVNIDSDMTMAPEGHTTVAPGKIPPEVGYGGPGKIERKSFGIGYDLDDMRAMELFFTQNGSSRGPH
jgi:hypothetical protein